MNKTVLLSNNRLVTVVSPENANAVLSETDIEMDYRAREAVKAVINRAEICKKPIAKYDSVNRKAYLQNADSKKIYVE